MGVMEKVCSKSLKKIKKPHFRSKICKVAIDQGSKLPDFSITPTLRLYTLEL